MITPTLNDDGFTGSILIEPNRPISWQENMRFIKLFALFSILIAGIAVYYGHFLVLPYSAIDLIAVSFCLYLVFKRYTICQIIYFTKNSVIIKSGDFNLDNRTEYQRYWSKFHVDIKNNYTIPIVTIRSKGKRTVIGDFLNYKDKEILINLIKELTATYQSQKYNITSD